MRIAVMPGSFDPFTLGHSDILARSCKLFDYVHVGVLVNKKKTGLFTHAERVAQIKKVIDDMGIKNADAESFVGLTADFAKQHGACAIIRGVRSVSDYENEMKMADLNAKIGDGIETVILFSKPENTHVSSSAVREICEFGGDISGFVPRVIYDEVMERTGNGNEE